MAGMEQDDVPHFIEILIELPDLSMGSMSVMEGIYMKDIEINWLKSTQFGSLFSSHLVHHLLPRPDQYHMNHF